MKSGALILMGAVLMLLGSLENGARTMTSQRAPANKAEVILTWWRG